MINKTDVSNLVTGLRPKVKQSAIHLAHHLTREIKKLENRKGDKAEKFKKKAENFRKEVLFLKKIQPDDVSRYAIMMDFNERQKLLNDVSLPFETKVIVKIATHKNITAHVENFRKSHTEWKDKLPDLLKNLGIFTQFKKKVEKQKEKSKRKLAKKKGSVNDSVVDSSTLATNILDKKISKTVSNAQKKVTAKKTPLLQKEATDGSDDSDAEFGNLEAAGGISDTESDHLNADSGHSDADSVHSDADSVHSDAESDELSDRSDQSDAESDKSDAQSGPSDAESGHSDAEKSHSVAESGQSDAESDNFEPVNEIIAPSIKVYKAPVKPKGPRISTASAFAVVRRFADLKQDENPEMERKLDGDSSGLPNEDISENDAVEEDTFFMTGENKFLKTVAVKREDGEGLPSSDKSSEKKSLWVANRNNQTGNRAERRARMRGDFSHKTPRNTRGVNTSKELNKSSHQFDKKDFNKVHRNSENSNSSTFKNQKQFNSNFNDKRNGKEFSKFNKKDFGNRKNDNRPAQPTAEKSLHPSWEAKRKQKVSLDSFQGKKIKFDD